MYVIIWLSLKIPCSKAFCQRAKKAEALKDINFNAVSVQNLHKRSDIYLFYWFNKFLVTTLEG